MSNKIYDISEIEINLNIEKIKITNNNYELFNSIELNVEFQDASSNLIKSKKYLIEGEEYLNWGNDDSYISEWFFNKIKTEEALVTYKKSDIYDLIYENNTILIYIEPVIKTYKLNKIEIENIAIFFSNGCWIDLIVKDENNNNYKKIVMKMNTDDYLLWGNDDTYLLNWINTNISSYLL